MAETQTITRNHILNELQQSRHGSLGEYQSVIGQACASDPEFLAHLIAFDAVNGQIKDSKIALPVITLTSREFPGELLENSLAHLALHPPRELLKALRFAIESKIPAGRRRRLDKVIRAYLAQKEAEPGKWARTAVRHRRPLKELYTRTHATVPDWVSTTLWGFKIPEGERQMVRTLRGIIRSGSPDSEIFRNDIKSLRLPAAYPPGSIFADIANLHTMGPDNVAATIEKWHLSPLIVSGALAGSKAQESSAVVQATIRQMSDTEMVTRAASLQKHVARDAGTKEAFRKKVASAVKSNKATLKTGHKAEELEDDSMREMLRELQERQIQAQKDVGRGIDGNWMIVVDRSLSQEVAITLGTHIGAAIAKFVTGKVWLAFCNSEITPVEVTGKTLEQIQAVSKFVFASGSTSYGIALDWAMDRDRLSIDGVIIVGDGGENTMPLFSKSWKKWQTKYKHDLPVYFFQTFCPPHHAMANGGNPRQFEMMMAAENIPVTKFDYTKGQIDYYSIPNTVQQLRISRFDMVEKVMACPLLKLEQVIPSLAKVGA